MVLPVAVLAQDAGQTWAERKCVLYQRAVTDATKMIGRDRLRDEFIKKNQEFITGGCLTQGNVCPMTGGEFEFANLLTVMTMNEGMASTFVPFGCRDTAGE